MSMLVLVEKKRIRATLATFGASIHQTVGRGGYGYDLGPIAQGLAHLCKAAVNSARIEPTTLIFIGSWRLVKRCRRCSTYRNPQLLRHFVAGSTIRLGVQGTPMSGTDIEDVKEQDLNDGILKDQVDSDLHAEDSKHLDENEENPMPSTQQEEEVIKKKYGGILPKKPPLISKDHERAFFDSADWALGKQGAKPKGPLEALRPKLQPTPHQQVRSRRSAYAPPDDGEDAGNDNDPSCEDQSCALEGSNENGTTSGDKKCNE
ncbi:hypothetical protein VitviT2T_000987 [Vitis vinifera]|uniref:cAMP-regulated phosphoprotein 19-related protein n=1 Tax=Vitis vinifera TaxID=29760 RepID=A0ABY9BEB7_VITVI|nr:hypothetical protein VitviT2T_000987 [Vitis vinifera]